jgi:phosphate transport system substrate-binding protein
VMNDSVRCWVGTVNLGGEQEAYYAKRTVVSHVVPMCTDAVALVVKKGHDLHSIGLPAITQLLTAKGSLLPLFAGNGSGVARSLVDSLLAGNGALAAQALPSVDSVVARVARDERYIGFLPFSAISDLDNPRMKALREQITLVAVGEADSSLSFLPSQSTLADGSYPLRRPVYLVLAEGKSGLGTGFVSFVANHKGQRILLKQGIAPNKVPPRDVEIVPN